MNLLVLSDAADLYRIWQVSLYGLIPERAWEQLTQRERDAWQAVVEFAADDLRSAKPDECAICHAELICENCDALKCPECKRLEPLLCEDCWSGPPLLGSPGVLFCVGEGR